MGREGGGVRRTTAEHSQPPPPSFQTHARTVVERCTCLELPVCVYICRRLTAASVPVCTCIRLHAWLYRVLLCLYLSCDTCLTLPVCTCLRLPVRTCRRLPAHLYLLQVTCTSVPVSAYLCVCTCLTLPARLYLSRGYLMCTCLNLPVILYLSQISCASVPVSAHLHAVCTCLSLPVCTCPRLPVCTCLSLPVRTCLSLPVSAYLCVPVPGYLRVCTYCCKVVLSYAQYQDASGNLLDLSNELYVNADADASDVASHESVATPGGYSAQRRRQRSTLTSAVFEDDFYCQG